MALLTPTQPRGIYALVNPFAIVTISGIVHVLDPQPYNYSFGNSEEEITKENLKYLDEVIQYEGPDNIAAMIVETVTGTNGILVPPKGYLQGLRKLLNQYDILLICDEIMSGFGRTGKMFAFEHFGIIPDIVTMAKGLTSAYIPLGCVGVSNAIADHFRKNVFWGGLTYNSHPLAMNTAMAVIEVMQEEGLVENAARLGKTMREEMDRLTQKHPSVKEGRCIGLFGMIDIQKNGDGEPMAPYNGTSVPMKQLASFFREEGLYTFLRWASFMCNPPLCITEEQLLEGFKIIDRGLDLTDQAFEG